MVKRSMAGLSILVLVVACATNSGVPASSAPERVTRVSAGGGMELELPTTADAGGSYWADAPVERVWSVLPLVYEQLGVPLSVHDSIGRRLGNTGFRPRRIGGTRLSQYLSCGRGVTATPNADRYQVNMSLITRLSEATDGGTNILTSVRATARPRDVGGTVVNCASTGRLESRISEIVNDLVGGD